MNRIQISLFSILLFGCCNESNFLKNGLTKKAIQITEYTIKVKIDSLNNEKQDTIFITKKKYNEKDQIISSHEQSLFDNETMDIEFIYNNEGNLMKEIVNLSNENSDYIVDYYYKEKLLLESITEFKNDVFQYNYVGKYKYDSHNKLKESTLEQLFIDNETNDTITNTLEISKYNSNEFVKKKHLIDSIKPDRNRFKEFKGECGILMEIKEYNSKDSLILLTKHKYVYDKYKNWIKRGIYENGRLNYLRTREIEYK
jgi:hypothetical protein